MSLERRSFRIFLKKSEQFYRINLQIPVKIRNCQNSLSDKISRSYMAKLSYYVFVQLTGLNLNGENEIYKKILKLPHIAWLITGVGRWDAVLLFCSQTIAQFNEQLEGLKRLFGKHLHEYTFTTLIQAEHLSYKFVRPSTKESLKTTSKNKIQTLDK